jgi:putative ABC transport system permease protein
MTTNSRLVQAIAVLVPERWRTAAIADLSEEAARRGGSRGRQVAWTAAQLTAIAARLRHRQLAGAFSIGGVFTGFVGQDLRAGLRRLLRTPLATAVAVLTLATAMAALTAVYAVLNGTVLSPLPFADPDRLVAVWQVEATSPDVWRNATAGNFVDWRRESRSFDILAAGRNTSHTLTGFDDGETPLTRRVTLGWFEAIGVTPQIGRTFTREESAPNGPPVALLSHDVWQRRYGGDPNVVGRAIELDQVPHTIVGVLPAGHDMPVFGLVDAPAVWLPLGLANAGEDRSINNLLVIGRLAAGVELGRARVELERIAGDLATAHPATNRDQRALVTPLAEGLVRNARAPMLFMLAAVIAVAAAACGNVAHVFLARTLSRRRELVMQQALGAPRLRILLQVAGEGLLVSIAAGLIGLLVATPLARAALLLVPSGFLAPRFLFTLDGSVLAIAAVAAVAAGLFASLPSIVVAGRRLDAAALSGESSRTIGSRDRRRWSLALVGTETAVAVILLIGAGLVAVGLSRLQAMSPGFEAEDAVTFRVSTRGPAYATAAARTHFYERVLEEFAAMPGVQGVGGTATLPVFPQFSERAAWRAEAPPPEPGRELRLTVNLVTPGFFDAMGIPRLAGRDVTGDDRADAPAVVLLSRSAARKLFGSEDALGRAIALRSSGVRTVTVAGIVGDVRSMADPTRVTEVIYLPWLQTDTPPAMGFVLRSRAAPAEIFAMAQAAVRRVDRGMPVYLARPLGEVAAAFDAGARFVTTLLSAFALLGIALVATGIYGTLSHLVADRRREIGVRIALGANRRDVLRLVLRDALAPAIGGLGLGLAAAVAVGRVAASALPGTPAFHWPLFLALPAILLTIVVAASAAPVLRAARANPVTALR